MKPSSYSESIDINLAIEEHLPLVKRIAHQICSRLPPNVEVDDLIQEVYDLVGEFKFERNDLHITEELKNNIELVAAYIMLTNHRIYKNLRRRIN